VRVLVTGAGLLGAHTAAELAGAGHPVALVDLRPDPRYLACVLSPVPPVFQLDVRDLSGLQDLLRQHRADAVVHTAGLLGVKANRNPYLAFHVNGGSCAAVAEAARRVGVPRLVQLSSLAVYDWPAVRETSTVDESFPTAPRTPYAASKLAGELAVRCYAASGWLDVTVLRLAGVYGPGLFGGGALLGGLLQQVVARAVGGRPVTVPVRLSGHEYLHAADAAAAVRLFLEQGCSGVYNVGTGRVHSADEVASAVRQAVPGASVRAAAGPPDLPPPLALRRVRRDLPDWHCRTLDAGVRELAGVLSEHPWLGAEAVGHLAAAPAPPRTMVTSSPPGAAKEVLP
jgi:UDP-glucose 4-epimerase